MTNWLWGLVNTLTAEDEYTRFQAWILPWVEKCYFLPLSCQFYGQTLCAIDSGMNFESNETRKTPLVTFGLRPNVTRMFRNSCVFSLIFGAFQNCLRSQRGNKYILIKIFNCITSHYKEEFHLFIHIITTKMFVSPPDCVDDFKQQIHAELDSDKQDPEFIQRVVIFLYGFFF